MRPKGVPNKFRLGQIRERIMAASKRAKVGDTDGLDRILDAVMAKAMGCKHAVPMANNIVIFDELPDPQAARVILEQMFGRPKESIEITDPAEKLRGTPQIILVPPPGWTGKQK